MLSKDLIFTIPAFTLWLWVMLLYVHVWIATRLPSQPPISPTSLSLAPQVQADWLLPLLGIAALATMIAGEALQLIAQVMVIGLLLPYFFSGVAVMHQASQRWPSRKFWLFMIYAIIISQLWPAFFLVALGFGHQLKNPNKDLPRG
jgi:hypothetical protein